MEKADEAKLRHEAYAEAQHEIARLHVAYAALTTSAQNWRKLGELDTTRRLSDLAEQLGDLIIETGVRLTYSASGGTL